mgnify:CR=1 FL=1
MNPLHRHLAAELDKKLREHRVVVGDPPAELGLRALSLDTASGAIDPFPLDQAQRLSNEQAEEATLRGERLPCSST